MARTKDRKLSGWVYPDSTINHEIKARDIIDQCLEPQPYWDDWLDYRDSYRDYENHKWHVRDRLKKRWKLLRCD